jgi:hypothetical protein
MLREELTIQVIQNTVPFNRPADVKSSMTYDR